MIVRIVYCGDKQLVGVFSEGSELPTGKDYSSVTTMLDGATDGIPNWCIHVDKEGIKYTVTRWYGVMRDAYESHMYRIYFVSAQTAAEALRQVLGN